MRFYSQFGGKIKKKIINRSKNQEKKINAGTKMIQILKPMRQQQSLYINIYIGKKRRPPGHFKHRLFRPQYVVGEASKLCSSLPQIVVGEASKLCS